MGFVKKESYDPIKVEKRQEYLRLYAEKGRPIEYEIVVDGFKAVRRTSDPEEFMDFNRFVDGDTKAIEILFFTGSSNNNDRYIFTLTDNTKEGLSGIDIDAKIAEQVDRQKRDWQHATLEREFNELKSEYAELEKELEKLEIEHKALKEQQSPLKGLLGEIGSTFVESFIRRNPSIIKSMPGGEALAGLINVPAQNPESATEGSVSFHAKGDSHELTEDEQAAVSFVEQLKAQFLKEEFDRVILILQALAEDKRKIDVVINTVAINRP
ncbi:hypothetical protein [Dawidia soli]|uniref:Uncharacterized protein n=1 Tax=Dawidia soli TaxID=2782352 RepID=A0AAP2DBW2_9BACT|nr:hypothetical protein [Dawidia soli]MBT1688884.1 hypothetical protein [Dawidia soli]